MNAELIPLNRFEGRFRAALMFEDAQSLLGMTRTESRAFLHTAREEGFRGQYEKTCLLRYDQGKSRLLIAGLGKRKEFEPDRIRVAAAMLIRDAEKMEVRQLGLLLAKAVPSGLPGFVEAAVHGAILAAYHYTEHRKLKDDDPRPPDDLFLCLPKGQAATKTLKRAVAEARAVADAVCYTRDLVNEPPSEKSPEKIAELATWLAKKGRISVQVLHKAELEKQGMNGILRVGAGSHEPPCLVHLHYKPKKARKTVCLVGKGITFDSGGLSLKPSTGMDAMKSDMAGAAAVLGVFKLLGDVNLPVEVHGLAPLAENLPGGSAQKPGDVLRAYSGKTVEVLNTDAEGRLILADALAFGSRLKPDVMVDMATLTGACVIAVGDEYSALFGTSRPTISALIRLGKQQGEWFWELPLVERYKSHIKSKVADIKNIGKQRVAGSIVAGLFLQEFVDKEVPWVHIDIAGPAFTQDGWDYARPGGTGVPVRTIAAWLKSL
ncbi:MAG: leucyl aminopeptidase [candidate division WOR-3 bacterium]|nr:MAG: leucyl aminopeptidase [candidate division WOR-3 bacterium]